MAFLRNSSDPVTSSRRRADLSSRNNTIVKFSFATLAAVGLFAVTMIGPYTGLVQESQAFDVVPFSKSDRIYQSLQVGEAASDISASITTQNFDVSKLPDPTPPPVVEPAADQTTKTTTTDSAKADSTKAPAQGTPDPGSAMAIAMEYVGPGEEYDCLVALWNKESRWNVYAENKSSGAYGIPQAPPGSKMASAGEDWATNADTQIRWGLGYIKGRYSSPCGAWAHSQSNGWY